MTGANQALAGIALVLAAGACFSTLDTTAKFVSLSTPLLMALWFRYAIQAVATTAVALPLRGWAVLRTAHPKFQLLRGALLATCSLLAFASLKVLPVPEFTAIVMLTPLAITVLAATLLKEHVSPLRWLLVAGGFGSTLMIVQPGNQAFGWAMLLPFALIGCNASFQILTSKLARAEDPMTTHLYTGWIGTLLASLALPFVWALPDTPGLWAAMVLMGLMGAIGHFVLIQAYARAPAATLTPFLYAQIGFSMLGGWLVFAHLPGRWALLGIAGITVCGAAGAWLTVRERREAVEAAES